MFKVKYSSKLLICSILTLLAWALVLSPVTGLPPLFHLLSPVTGVWKNHFQFMPSDMQSTHLNNNVSIQVDDSGIPHIFAVNESDLFFTQGYLHAYHRLFQMDVQTRAGGGELAALLGKDLIDVDKKHISMGLREGSRAALTGMMANKVSKLAIESYINGVNFYIQQLKQESLPVEYKLLNQWPELWQPVRVAQFLKIQSKGLAGKSYDLELTRLRSQFSHEQIESLIKPTGIYKRPVFNDEDIPISEISEHVAKFDNSFVSRFSGYDKSLEFLAYDGFSAVFVGSNNWAVAPEKSQSGVSLLSNDTHLQNNLPNMWYEMQLNAPGYNVYGGSFAGVPGIILGANNNLSWGSTNTTIDVMDFYEVEFKDTSFSEYLLDGAWHKSEISTEIINVANSLPVNVQRIKTRHGFIIDKKDTLGLAIKWIAHESSNDWLAFYNLGKSTDVKQCHTAIKEFTGPAQNFVCADKNNIGLFQQGYMPVKLQGQGDYVLDGRDSHNLWNGTIDYDLLPHTINPQSGYVSSANQLPTSKSYPYYLGWFFDDSFRGGRIQDLLQAKEQHTAQDLVSYQHDVQDDLAQQLLPILLNQLELKTLDKDKVHFVSLLKQWDFKVTGESVAASFFYYWWPLLRDSIWQQALWHEDQLKFLPIDSVSIQLFKSVNSKNNSDIDWFIKEQGLDSIILIYKTTEAFNKAWDILSMTFGENYMDWLWHNVSPLNMQSISGLDAFSGNKIISNGSANTIKVNKDRVAPTWKMVAEMSHPVQIYTQTPGGVDGNPFSPKYDDFTGDWARDKMRKALFLDKPSKEFKTINFEAVR